MKPPLVAHVVHRFDTGGLENGIVNLINHLDEGACRHAVIALTEVTDFARRIRRPDVTFVSLNKPPGQGLWHTAAWTRALRQLRPDIVHTRNLGTLEMQLPAALAGVPVRLHGEHGRDLRDPHGTVRRYRWIRRGFRPLVHRWVALSRELSDYLVQDVGVPPQRVETLCNGVDTQRFQPPPSGRPKPIEGCPFDPAVHRIVGTVGRLQPEKDQQTLVEALARLRQQAPAQADAVRLVIAGEGAQRQAIEASIARHGLHDRVWLAGERRDVPEVLQGLHLFALPSRAEGISNTILEAMACGLPVVATQVGGNPELVATGRTGALVPPGDAVAMAIALHEVLENEDRCRAMGLAGRQRVECEFSLSVMVGRYQRLYEGAWAVAAAR